MSDRLIGLLLLLVCGFFYWQSVFIKRPPFAAFEALGAETFPRAVLTVLALFSGILLLRGGGHFLPRLDRERAGDWLREYRLPLLSLVLFAFYALAVALIGWLAATVAYLLAMQLVLQPRRGRQLVPVVAGSVAFSWLVASLFERFLHVVLPRAALF